MKKPVLVFILATAACLLACEPAVSEKAAPGTAKNAEAARWEREAASVTITRDDWGIAHVYGKTDADAVFGMIYAQAEDDFNRVETNYINGMGRLAEAEGQGKIYQDLRMKLFIDPPALRKEYAASPDWLKKLMNAFADGLNYYLSKHPEVKPRVIKRFEPWMALSFTEGSIGGDIERVSLTQLEAFYGKVPVSAAPSADDDEIEEPSGSNGMAIAPSNTANHHSLLLINPHTSFFFRSELHMVSGEGLDVYGAVTWGQFFVYQGFNEHAGWMHTSSGVNALTEYLETVGKKGDRYVYKKNGPSRRKRLPCRIKPRRGWRKRNSRCIARITARSCARRTGSG
jgi:acyl-homoserine-lactone acylase